MLLFFKSMFFQSNAKSSPCLSPVAKSKSINNSYLFPFNLSFIVLISFSENISTAFDCLDIISFLSPFIFT